MNRHDVVPPSPHRGCVTAGRARSIRPTPIRQTLGLSLLVAVLGVLHSGDVFAQVRTKQPDRDVYEPPQLDRRGQTRAAPEPRVAERPQRRQAGAAADSRRGQFEQELVEVVIDGPAMDAAGHDAGNPAPPEMASQVAEGAASASKLRPVNHDEIWLEPAPEQPAAGEGWVEQPWDGGSAIAGCDSFGGGACGFEGGGCDSFGCDSCRPRRQRLSNAAISLHPQRWFGSVELLLMFRKGDTLPPLVTTGPADDPETAGELGQPGTGVRFGGERMLKDMTAGGRFMVGTWLDDQKCRSLTVRGWFAGEESTRFSAETTSSDVLARPFLDVSDPQAPEQDTLLVSFPDRSSGSLDARLDSEIYGADVAVQQFWTGGYGGTVDLLYGYQYLRLDEGLGISSTTMSLDDDVAPVGSVISIADSFDATNEFHGGQLGVTSRYREGCWSFDSLVKIGFGQLRRQARRRGRTVTRIDDATATTNEGLLVRESNSGTVTDHTFGWVPELDLSLGWHRFPRFDVTVGYHLTVLTDALQSSGMVDSQLAADLNDPQLTERPSPALRHSTFYVQGIHFGLKYVY